MEWNGMASATSSFSLLIIIESSFSNAQLPFTHHHQRQHDDSDDSDDNDHGFYQASFSPLSPTLLELLRTALCSRN
jgi:hypothetical protein